MKVVAPRPVEHGFLEGAPLFASYHAPTAPARTVAYVLCLPLHLELIQSYRSMRRCAEEMAAAGFHVLRVDYEGTQESVGSTDHDPNRVDLWLESVRRATELMKEIPGVESVGLIGVRMGGTFALHTATKMEVVSHLVLWELSAGAAYCREMEILALSNQHNIQRGGVAAGGSAEKGVVVGGYWLSEGTLSDLSRLDPETMEPKQRPDVLLVYRGDRKPSTRLQQHLEKVGCRTTLCQLAGHKEMMVMPQRSAEPAIILAAIRDWAVEHSQVADGPPQTRGIGLASEVVVDGLRWRTVRFGSGDHLFGVITEPEAGPTPSAPAVLLLTGGVTPRTAGNQSYVTLARRLAKRGHAVLRMDISFIGESGTPDGLRGNDTDPYPPSILDDARAGLDLISTAARGASVWVLGLCSGAYAAFQVALGDNRARGVLLLNPERFELGDEAALASDSEERPMKVSTVDQLGEMNRYRQRIRDPKSWKRLLTGEADASHLMRVIRARARSTLASVTGRVAVLFGLAATGLPGDLAKLLTRGLTLGLIFSEGDLGQLATLTEIGPHFAALEEKGLILKVFAGADHNFHEMASRAELVDWVEATIANSA